MDINVWQGVIISFVVISIWKLIRYQFRDRSVSFSFRYWLANNWADYPTHIGITVLWFLFENDASATINPLLQKWGTDWQVPSPENKGFLFVLIPLVVSLVLYPILRKILSKPVQKAVAPKIHEKHSV